MPLKLMRPVDNAGFSMLSGDAGYFHLLRIYFLLGDQFETDLFLTRVRAATYPELL